MVHRPPSQVDEHKLIFDSLDELPARTAAAIREDGRTEGVWLERGDRLVLAFAPEGDVATIAVTFRDGLEDRSDGELERLLDEART